MTITAPEGHVHRRRLVLYPSHSCGNGGTCVYTGGVIAFDTLNHDSSKGGTIIHLPSHAMSMTMIPTDRAIYI